MLEHALAPGANELCGKLKVITESHSCQSSQLSVLLGRKPQAAIVMFSGSECTSLSPKRQTLSPAPQNTCFKSVISKQPASSRLGNRADNALALGLGFQIGLRY